MRNGLVHAVRAELAAAGDPNRAPGMQAYMKSAIPYRGVTSRPLREISRTLFAAHPLPTFEAWRDTALELWREATYREERYAAIALTGDKRYAAYQGPAALPMYEEMIVTGAWWDYVDEVAIRRVGAMLPGHRTMVEPMLRAWSTDTDIWRRRTSIIAQVGLKRDVDTSLLEACIAPNLADREFFIRKAIGWALRSYAWVEPEWVRAYVSRHEAELSGLSRREALKNLG